LDRLSVEGSLYLGGYPGTPSYEGISSGNFSGCIESLHLDGNPIDLSRKYELFIDLYSNMVDVFSIFFSCLILSKINLRQ
jgi:hypothetical protein